jgi:anti-sigma-K factor RskA
MTMTCEEIRELAPSFVLGALEESELRTVRDHLATCPEVHEEFAALGSVVVHLAESVDLVEPPAGLRARVLGAAAAEIAARSETRPGATVSGPRIALPRSPDRTRRWALRPVWLVGLAAALAIVALGAWNLGLQADLSDARAFREHVGEVLAIARTQGATVAVLMSTEPGANSGFMAVGADGRAAIVVSGLPATTGNEVYELWVIVGSNPPAPVGALTQSGALAFLTGAVGPVPPGATVALTREPAPNATTPTLPIVSKGVAGTSS